MRFGPLKRLSAALASVVVGFASIAIPAAAEEAGEALAGRDRLAQATLDPFRGAGWGRDGRRVAEPAAACVAFEHADFKGDRLRLAEGQRYDRLSAWNDRISSIAVAPGCAARVGAREGFAGRSEAFSSDADYVGPRWNDAISSIACSCDDAGWRRAPPIEEPQRRASGSACVVYDRRDFEGERLDLRPDQVFERLRNWNDRISSARIAPGCRLEVGEDWNFAGARETATGDVGYFGSAWSNRVSSMACACEEDWERGRSGARAPAPPEPSRGGAACVVFEDPGFGGVWRAFEAGEEERTLGRRLEQQVSSVRVAPGCVALLDVNRTYKLWIEQNIRDLGRGQRDRADTVSCFCPRAWR